MDLMDLVKEMSEEEQRYAREGFSSDEELSIYDLLFSDNLSKSDIQKIKQLSVELLGKIKDRISRMDHWTDKDETRATVQNLIRDELYMNIPDSMFDQLDHYREVIYEHVYTHYKEAAYVFCKTEMQKVAERSCRLLQLQNVGNCRRSITDG